MSNRMGKKRIFKEEDSNYVECGKAKMSTKNKIIMKI